MCNSKKIFFMLPLLLGVLIFRVTAQTGENSSVSKTGGTTSLGLSGSASVSLEALESLDKNVASARAAYGKELKIELTVIVHYGCRSVFINEAEIEDSLTHDDCVYAF